MISTDYGVPDKPLYRLESLLGSVVEGFFYKEELIPAPDLKEENYFVIEDILQTRTRNNEVEHFVSYIGFGPKYDRWVKEKDILK